MKKIHVFMMCMLSIVGYHNAINSMDPFIIKKDDQYYDPRIASLQQQSFLDQFHTLTAAGITAITTAQIATMSLSLIPMITNDQIQSFTPAQIAAFTPAQIQVFTPGQIMSLTVPTSTNPSTINQIAACTPAQIAAMLPLQIAAMNFDQLNVIIPKLTATQIQNLTLTQIQNLPNVTLAAQLMNITNKQISFISLQQIATLGSAIIPFITNLAPMQFASLSQAQIMLIPMNQLNAQLQNLTVTQIGYLVPTQIAAITNDQINTQLTYEQLNALLTILENSTIITTTNNPHLASQISAIISTLQKKSAEIAPTQSPQSLHQAPIMPIAISVPSASKPIKPNPPFLGTQPFQPDTSNNASSQRASNNHSSQSTSNNTINNAINSGTQAFNNIFHF